MSCLSNIFIFCGSHFADEHSCWLGRDVKTHCKTSSTSGGVRKFHCSPCCFQTWSDSSADDKIGMSEHTQLSGEGNGCRNSYHNWNRVPGCCAYNEAYAFVADEFEVDFELFSQMIKIFAKLEMWFRLVHDGCWVCFRSYFWHQFSEGFFLQRNILLIFVTKLKLPKTINPKYFEFFSVLVFLMFWTYICSHLFWIGHQELKLWR